MNQIFDPQNRFWNFMNKIMDVFLLGVLWFLFSLPVITMGAATTSLYQFTLKQTDDEEGYVCKSFLKAFVKNFKKATILWLILLAIGIFLAADVYACLNITVPGVIQTICFGVLMCLCLICLLTALYVFPILSRFERSVMTILRHSFIMAMGNLYVSVTVLVIYAAAAVLTYYWTILFPIWIAMSAFLSSYLFRSVFRRYWQETQDD